jgi:hypothetical protein
MTHVPGSSGSETGERYITYERDHTLLRVQIRYRGVWHVKRFSHKRMEDAIEWRDDLMKKLGLWTQGT